MGKYLSLDPLPSSDADSKAMENVLKQTSFKVFTVTDKNTEKLKSAVDYFARESRGAKATFFYFSGHGLRHDGNNYICAVDFNSKTRKSAKSWFDLEGEVPSNCFFVVFLRFFSFFVWSCIYSRK